MTRFLKLFQIIWSPLGITANAISDLLEIYIFLGMVQEQKHLTHHGITLSVLASGASASPHFPPECIFCE